MQANTTTDLVQHIERLHGPRRALPLHWLVPLSSVYAVILISGLIGNFITILVILRFRYMQTITNLYLCNLAITDLISLLLSLPLELYTIWHQYPWQLGEVMCRVKTLVLEGTANASVLTLVTFTVERFMAICGSSKPPNQNMFTPNSPAQMKKIALRNIGFIWALSLLGASPMVAYTRINYLEYNGTRLVESAWCGLPYNEPDRQWEWVMLTSTVLFFLIPLAIITLLYYGIAQKLRRATRLDPVNHSDMQLTDHATSRKIVQSRRIVIRMLVVIVIAFSFCWAPFHAQRLLFLYVSLYSDWSHILRKINEILYVSAGCLYYLNSSINPLIYSLLSTRFRAAFLLYVNGCCGQWMRKTGGPNTGTGGGGGGGAGGTNPSTSGPRSQRGAIHNNACNGCSDKIIKNFRNSNNSLAMAAGVNHNNNHSDCDRECDHPAHHCTLHLQSAGAGSAHNKKIIRTLTCYCSQHQMNHATHQHLPQPASSYNNNNNNIHNSNSNSSNAKHLNAHVDEDAIHDQDSW